MLNNYNYKNFMKERSQANLRICGILHHSLSEQFKNLWNIICK